MGKSGEKVGKSGDKLENLGKVGKRREKWEYVVKRWGKWLKVGKGGDFWMSEKNFRSQFLPFQIDTQLFIFLKFLDKMAAGGHFGLDDNGSYRTRPRYLDE